MQLFHMENLNVLLHCQIFKVLEGLPHLQNRRRDINIQREKKQERNTEILSHFQNNYGNDSLRELPLHIFVVSKKTDIISLLNKLSDQIIHKINPKYAISLLRKIGLIYMPDRLKHRKSR